MHALIVLLRRAVKRAAVQPEKGPFLWGGQRWSGSYCPQRETNCALSSLIGRMTEIGFCGSASAAHNKERKPQLEEAGKRENERQRSVAGVCRALYHHRQR